MSSLKKLFVVFALGLLVLFNAGIIFLLMVVLGKDLKEILLQYWFPITIAQSLLLIASVVVSLWLAQIIATPIKKLSSVMKKIAAGDLNQNINANLLSKNELGLLANNMNECLKNFPKIIESKKKEADQESETKLAKNFQQTLLPKTLPAMPDLDLAPGLIPAGETGGDLYDIVKVGQKTYMYSVDVTGKGLPSLSLTMFIHYFIHALIEQYPLKELLTRINQTLHNKTQGQSYGALIFFTYDHETKKLTYMNAGYTKPVIFNMKDKKTHLLEKSGPALGMFENIETHLQEEEIFLDQNDVVVCYSDGLVEAKKNTGEAYGLPRFKRAVNEYADLPSALALRNALFADVKEFCGNEPSTDDWTLVVLKKT